MRQLAYRPKSGINRFANLLAGSLPSGRPAPDHGSTDGQPNGASDADMVEDQAEKQRIDEEKKRKARQEAEVATPVGSPGSEKSAIGPMGSTATIAGDKYSAREKLRLSQLGLGAQGMRAFTAGVERGVVVANMFPGNLHPATAGGKR